MSRGQRTTRSSSSRRTISETDSEEESSVQRNLITGRSDLNSNVNLASANHGFFNRGTHNHNNISSSSQMMSRSNLALSSNNMRQHSEGTPENNRRSYFPESPQLNVSDVQYSYFDRARWFIWKCIYIKIIKNINFDVWCLSRLHNYGKSKAIFMLLLPLLLFVIWGSMQEEWQTCLAPSTGAMSYGLHSIANFASFLPFLRSYSSHQEEDISSAQDSQITPETTPGAAYLFSGLSNLFLGLFYKPSENPANNPELSEYISLKKESKEEIRLLAVEILKEESRNLLESFKASLSHLPHNGEKEENEEKFKVQIDGLQQEIKDFKERIVKLDESIKLNIQRMNKLETTNEFESNLQQNVDSINAKLKILEEKIGAIGEVKKCCDHKWNLESIEISLIAALKKIIKSESKDNSTYQFLYDWLNSKFVNQETVTEEIKLAVQQLKAEPKTSRPNFEKIIENLVLKQVEAMKANLTSTTTAQDFSSERSSSSVFSEDNVEKMIKEALLIYDADKTGKADYALESGGGSIIGTRCSEAYVEKSGKFSIFGLPLWSLSSSPRTVIQPGMQPGQCWAFKGSQGFLVLELSSVIYPSGFTLEHIPISLSPTESIDSAPKEFSVWGLLSEEDNSGKMLGKYLYDIKEDPLQYFPIQNFIGEPFQYLELKIHNNHGNMDYTCLYRFRVHGKRAR
ncbi:klaroid protein-like [Uloborus diversus]|uniref:klaroid protein-like n=1 Tax=Uloborus diversus TaxID=327109 RepID=UPI00240A1C69|nr:klaroid protein-like [Uloborus diversus]